MSYERVEGGKFTKKKDKNIIYLENVYKSYGDLRILNDIDLSVSEGEFVSVVGPSGCGKSTLLKIVLGQERASAGTVLFEGNPIVGPDVSRGIVYQRYGLYLNKTVLENVLMGKQLAKGLKGLFGASAADKEEAFEYLRRVRLEDAWNKYPHELSGGMQQRVAIAQALIMKPKILMMDEPFGALDPGTREELQLFLSELWEETQMTIFFVTHDLEEAVFLGTRLIVLSQFYSEGMKKDEPIYEHKGARIVKDVPLFGGASSTQLKEKPEFGELIQKIRKAGFTKDYLQHVTDFNLTHKDSFQTLTKEDIGILKDEEIN
ncbi:ABC transporter ATP-binding protein [bacterium]|nr:ABC transporter ATP-binding protein [bacterium]